MNRLQVELDIEGIERMCDRATSGNVAHVIGTIKSYCRMMKEELDVPDWTHYKVQASLAALQGLLANPNLLLEEGDTFPNLAVRYADALIEELKEK